jgi:hypothetical protein
VKWHAFIDVLHKSGLQGHPASRFAFVLVATGSIVEKYAVSPL